MIIIANNILYSVKNRNSVVAHGRAARRGEGPFERPVRIRIGEPNGENVAITLRWNDAAEMVSATTSRAFPSGLLAKVTIDEPDAADGIAIRVDTPSNTPIRITRTKKG